MLQAQYTDLTKLRQANAIMPSNMWQIALILLVNMAAISAQVNELASLIAKIGSLQDCDIQVSVIFHQ